MESEIGRQGQGEPLGLRRTLPCDDDAPGAARVLVEGLLEDCDEGDATRRGDVILAVSELVSNAVMHGPPGDLELRVGVEDALVRIEVIDQGVKSFEWPEGLGAGGHWGLGLVREMADRSGIERLPQTCTWCEIDLKP